MSAEVFLSASSDDDDDDASFISSVDLISRSILSMAGDIGRSSISGPSTLTTTIFVSTVVWSTTPLADVFTSATSSVDESLLLDLSFSSDGVCTVDFSVMASIGDDSFWSSTGHVIASSFGLLSTSSNDDGFSSDTMTTDSLCLTGRISSTLLLQQLSSTAPLPFSIVGTKRRETRQNKSQTSLSSCKLKEPMAGVNYRSRLDWFSGCLGQQQHTIEVKPFRLYPLK